MFLLRWIFSFTLTFQLLIQRVIHFVLQCSSHAVRCFAGGPRRSNESQCPMLQKGEKHTSLAATVPMVTKSTIIRNHLNSTCSVTNSPHRKKLRFQLAKERKASTTLGIIMSAFIVCWLPFFVLALVRPFLSGANQIPAALSSLFLWLGYCNSLFNPIIYATLNRDFRKPFREILYFRCGNLNHMMREEFYQSQYGYPVNNHDNEGGRRFKSHGVEPVDVVSDPANESFLWSTWNALSICDLKDTAENDIEGWPHEGKKNENGVKAAGDFDDDVNLTCRRKKKYTIEKCKEGLVEL